MKQIRQIVNSLIGKEAVFGIDTDKGRVDDPATERETAAVEEDSAGKNRTQDMSVSLTVLDRKNFDRIVSESLDGGQKTGCLLVCDVDRCKEIHDIYGHDTGDAVLRNVESVLRGVFGDSVCIGSPGDDVFTLWLPVVPQENADDIRRQVGIVNDRLLHPVRELPPVSISVGAAFCRVGEDCKSIHKRANQMLYLVKESGRCGCEMSL